MEKICIFKIFNFDVDNSEAKFIIAQQTYQETTTGEHSEEEKTEKSSGNHNDFCFIAK